jgi:hypothetical protein
VQKTIAELERKAELKLNVLKAQVAPRNLVNSDTITCCFRKAEFGITSHNMNVEEDLIDEDDWYKVLEN